MITLNSVYLKYTKEYNTLNNINLHVNEGEVVVLYGEKESGKSALLRLIAGLEKASEGEVFVKNINVNKINFKTDVAFGYLSLFSAYQNGKTVKQNLEYVLKIRKLDNNLINSKVNGALLSYGLEGLKDTKIKDLNAFDKVRVSIARLSLRKLEVLVCDDIFEGFSDVEVKKLAEYVLGLVDQNSATTIITVSDAKKQKLFDTRVIKLKFGSIVEG